jgi:hypothetical protein
MSVEKMRPCRCHCGEELVIACPKGCENAELGATADPDPISRTRKPTVEEQPRVRFARAVPKVAPAAHPCVRCGKLVPPRSGKPPREWIHDSCLTADELRRVQARRRSAAKQRERAGG